MDAVPSTVWPETFNVPDEVRPVEDAFPRVVCPVTLRVPLDVREEVAVILPPLREEKVEVMALSVVAKKLVEVAFVAVRFVKKPVVAFRRVVKKLVEVAFVITPFTEERLVEVLLVVNPFVALKLVAERLVVDAFPRVVCPVTFKVEAVVVARLDVPNTLNPPVVVAFPLASMVKLLFAVQALPFQ